MEIYYTEEKKYTLQQVQRLFHSVQWESANYPTRLYKALENSPTVITAWKEEKLIGLINGIDDGELTAYIHYVLVDPLFQGEGIGKELVKKIKEKYREYRYVLLIAETKELINYYEKMGFEQKHGQYPMAILNTANQE
ncbi:MAG: GNAT family N-acetyltransferase [Clostridiales bacterium]|nr:GNAT family N-acetyltransferase [Clostridiales bacterium]